MYHSNARLILYILLSIFLPGMLFAQNLDVSGSWVTVNVDNCCAGQYNEFAGGQVQDFTIPATVSKNAVYFLLRGGDGGFAKAGDNCKSEGGDGATTRATFFVGHDANKLKPGGKIRFIVGKHGKDDDKGGTSFADSGGGGGTAVLYQPTQNDDWILLAVAGGGGGAYQGNVFGGCVDSQKGQGGRATENGDNGAGSGGGSGGTNGNGGSGGDGGGSSTSGTGGGGGAYGHGGVGTNNWGGGGGMGYPGGGSGGLNAVLGFDLTSTGSGGWGFGGGGAASGAGGGGGGYSGGGGAGGVDNGGGGGSYVNNNFAYIKEFTAGGASGETDHGSVGYQFFTLCAPEIATVEQINGFCGDFASPPVDLQVHLTTPGGCSNVSYALIGAGPPIVNTTGFFTVLSPGIYTVQLYKTVGNITQIVDQQAVIVSLDDNLPPSAECKDITLGIPGDLQIFPNLADRIDNGSSDNCGIDHLAVNQTGFGCSQISTLQTVTLTVTDLSGNTATCTSQIILRDIGAPVPDVPNLPVLTGECTINVTTAPTATDACTGAITGFTNDPLSYSEFGTYTITWRYRDSRGNESTQLQTVMVTDQTAPTVVCPADIMVQANQNSCTATVDYLATLNDNCESIVTPVAYLGNTINVPAGDNRILLAQVCHFDQVTEATYDGSPMTLAVKQNAAIAGTCEVWYILLGSGAAINGSIQLIGAGEAARVTTFEHVDQQNPFGFIAKGKNKNPLVVKTRPKDMIYEGFMRKDGNAVNPWSGQTELFDAQFNLASSRCWAGYKAATGGLDTVKINTSNGAHVALVLQAEHRSTFSYSTEPGTAFTAGTTLVSFTATDQGGNTSTCSFNVNVQDITPPTLSCPEDITVDATYSDQDICTMPVTYTVTANDNCSNTTLSNLTGMTSGADFPIGTTVNTLQVSDEAGMTTTCTFSVTVRDVIAPEAYCQCKTIFLDESGSASVATTEINNNSYDVCGSISSTSLDLSSFTCDDQGSNTVTLTVTDDSGNSSTCEATVTVEDNIAPVANCTDLTIDLVDRNTYQLSASDLAVITATSSDNCGSFSATLDTGTTSYDCDDRGASFTFSIILADNAGNNTICTAQVTVADPNSVCNDPPTAFCQDITVAVADNCEVTIAASDIDGGSSDPDLDELLFSLDNGGPFEPGSQLLTLSVSDGEYIVTCQASVTIEDNTAPVLTCGADLTVSTDPGTCSRTLTVPLPVATDNCEVNLLRFRYRQVDAAGNNLAGENWTAWSTAVTQTLALGHWKVQWQAKDASGNQRKCSYLIQVSDTEAPKAICHNPVLTFNGEDELFLDMEMVWNEAASSDNCPYGPVPGGDVFFLGTSIDKVTCDQLNSTIPVTVMVEDNHGNTATCTANVSVTGLPCSWKVDTGGLDCAPGVGSYDNNTAMFSLSSSACYDPSYYRLNDAQGFIQTDFCGDGEIVAQVAGVVGNGWAGITMRESNDPSAQMIQLMIDGISSSRREARMSPGTPAFTHQFQTQGKNWLRLSRSGNLFSAYHSIDGSNWSTVFSTQIAMSYCIYVGMITMNGSPTGELTGVYENVSVTGTNALVAPGTVDIAQEQVSDLDFQIYPNPTTYEVTLQLDQFIGKDVTLRLYNHYGQAVWQQSLGEVRYNTERLNLGQFAPGTYLVELQSGSERVTKRVVVVSRN